MSKIRTFVGLLKKPLQLIPPLARCGLLSWMPDKAFLKVIYKAETGEIPDIENPKTFCEKLQWLKLYDRKPQYTQLVDKYAVREIVVERLGEDCLVPLLGVWDSPEEIDFDSLPNQFVLKCTHDSGSIIICEDKTRLNIKAVRKQLNKMLKRNFYNVGREWPYKKVKHRIVAEAFLTDGEHEDLRDYKFYCFSGVPTYCQVICDRKSVETIDFFDMDWQLQNFTGLCSPQKPFPHASKEIPMPSTLNKMKRAAACLSEGIPFARVDFYEVHGKMYFGEVTFYPAAGFGVFMPEEWNSKLGEMICLPKKQTVRNN